MQRMEQFEDIAKHALEAVEQEDDEDEEYGQEELSIGNDNEDINPLVLQESI